MAERLRSRLDPFAFPTNTTFRFVLLVASVLGASLYLYNAIYLSIGNRAADLAAYRACLDAAPQASVLDADELDTRADFLHDCTAPIEEPKAAFMLTGLLLLAAGAVVVYWLFPAWKLRRGRFEPLTSEEAPEVVAELDRLARVAGLRRSPAWVWDPLAPAPTGLAFGRLGRRYVALTGGLAARLVPEPDVFRAVVLHELAHLRNRDVDRTYLTIAVWWAFVGLALVPFAISLPGEPREYVLGLIWRVLLLTALVYAVRNSVLRAREHDADLRAGSWGVAEPLKRVLASLPAATGGRLARLRSVHPDPERRVAALDDPAPLLSIGFGEAFATGAAATLAYAEVASLLGFFSNEGLEVRWLAALVFAPLAAAVIGFGVWRATYGALATRRPLPNGVLLGLGLGLGLALGQTLSFSAAVPDDIADQSLRLIGFEPAWALVLVGSQVLFCSWLVAGAAAWVSRASDRAARRVAQVGVVIGAAALAVWLGLFFLAYDLGELWPIVEAIQSETYDAIAAVVWLGPETVWQAVQHPFVLVVLDEPFALPLLIALWAFPLAAALVGRRSETGIRLAPGRAFAVGIGGAVVYAVAIVVLRAILDVTVSEATADGTAFALSLFYWLVAVALLVQLGTAVAAALLAPSLRVVHGLFAAFVAGSGSAGSISVVNSASGCVDFITVSSATECGWVSSAFVWLIYRQVVAEGAVVALVGALAASLVLELVSRSREPGLRVAGVAR